MSSIEAPAWPRTRIVLVRHGESNVTVARVIGGPRTCSGLSQLGRQQAERLRDRIAATGELGDAVIVASAYRRAQETASLIAPAIGPDVEVVVDADLGEHDPGPDCDGMAFVDFVERYGMPDWEADPYGLTFPGGETVAEFSFRVGTALSRLVREHPGQTIAVVCHGGVVDQAFRQFLRLPVTGSFELFTTNASLTEFVHVGPGRWRLARYNDAAHLAGLPLATPRD